MKKIVVALVVALIVALVAASVSSPLSSSVSLVYAQEKMREETNTCGLDTDYFLPYNILSRISLPSLSVSSDYTDLNSFSVDLIQVDDSKIVLKNLSLDMTLYQVYKTREPIGNIIFSVSSFIYNYDGDSLSIYIENIFFSVNQKNYINLESGLSDFYIKAECNKSVAEERSFN